MRTAARSYARTRTRSVPHRTDHFTALKDTFADASLSPARRAARKKTFLKEHARNYTISRRLHPVSSSSRPSVFLPFSSRNGSHRRNEEGEHPGTGGRAREERRAATSIGEIVRRGGWQRTTERARSSSLPPLMAGSSRPRENEVSEREREQTGERASELATTTRATTRYT